jgi:hypothetical protein
VSTLAVFFADAEVTLLAYEGIKPLPSESRTTMESSLS